MDGEIITPITKEEAVGIARKFILPRIYKDEHVQFSQQFNAWHVTFKANGFPRFQVMVDIHTGQPHEHIPF